jgi:ABC-type branched-subunit amino acid transport system substrate-binding protein
MGGDKLTRRGAGLRLARGLMGASAWSLALPMAQAAGTLVFAQIASQTNISSASVARGSFMGAKAYFDQVNDKGGVAGRTLQIVNHNDELNIGKMFEIVTRKVIPDPSVIGLLGFVNTGGLTALSTADLFARANIAMVAPLAGDHQVVDADNVFPFRAGYTDEIKALVKHVRSRGFKKLAVVYYTVSFGPSMSMVAEQAAKAEGLQVFTVAIDGVSDKIAQNSASAAAAVNKQQPDALLMVLAGGFATEFARAFKAVDGRSVALYGTSAILGDDMIKALGGANARGTVLSQAVPSPYSQSIPLIKEYQALMKDKLPAEPLSYPTLEGFIGAKIAVEGLKRAGNNPTRESLVNALAKLGDFDLGGVRVNYSKARREGWMRVEVTYLREDGRLLG